MKKGILILSLIAGISALLLTGCKTAEHASAVGEPVSAEGVKEFKKAFAPEEMHDLISAEVHGSFGDIVLTDKGSLSWIENSFGKAEKLDGWPNCPYDMTITLKRSDGAVFTVQPATDSCNNMLAVDVWYSYGDKNSERLFELFGLKAEAGTVTRIEAGAK